MYPVSINLLILCSTESISLPLKYRGKVKANMRHIEAITGITISVNDDQSFGIFASNLQDLNSAKSMIEELHNDRRTARDWGNMCYSFIVTCAIVSQ